MTPLNTAAEVDNDLAPLEGPVREALPSRRSPW
jgi:hypothetical protein